MKILITDSGTLQSNGDISLDVFKQIGEVFDPQKITREQLLQEVKSVDAVICNKTIIDEEVMANAPSLKYIGTFATGYNNIDLSAADRRGITVCNAPGYSTNAVAQQVMAYILSHYTKIGEYGEFVRQDGWKNSESFSPFVFPTDEVAGKTLGIVGFGAIGAKVAKMAKAFDMNIMVYTRTPKDCADVKFVSFETLLSESDVITLHCPLTPETADLMNKEAFSKMKDGAYFINTSRGGTVDEEALLEALKSGKLSGAAVDVIKTEPMSCDCILCGAPNLLITPHSAWAPYSTRKRVVTLAADNLKAFLEGQPVNVVNNP